jgi:predicted small lipoprotein YifL
MFEFRRILGPIPTQLRNGGFARLSVRVKRISRLCVGSLLGVSLLAASGCGQKGPLYLPDTAQNASTPTTSSGSRAPAP